MSRLITLTVTILATGAQAEQDCASHDAMLMALAERWTESRAAMGLISDKAVMELYASAAGTWTFVVTLPNGTSCIMASGDHFETLHDVVIPGVPG